MDSLIELLRERGRNHLADCILENAKKPALLYSQQLNSYSPSQPMEKEMGQAFRQELERIGVKDSEKILTSIKKRRILQTAPHLGATESPRMLCINWLGSLGVSKDEFYVVGMFSGIPFSNNSRPGRINRKEDSINLFPASMQDALVYRSAIPEKLVENVETLPPPLKKLLPEAKIGDSYTHWALQVCTNVERKILGKENLVYLDINEVVANYIEKVKNKPGHPINKILQNEVSLGEPLFHQDNGSCPGLFLTFLALSFLNHFRCFGSFRQVEYLPEYQKKLARLEFMKIFEVEKVPTASLTTGEFASGPYPADIIIEGGEFSPDPNMLFGELIINMKDKLLDENKK